jgi:hypothetical protein
MRHGRSIASMRMSAVLSGADAPLRFICAAPAHSRASTDASLKKVAPRASQSFPLRILRAESIFLAVRIATPIEAFVF